MTVVCESPDCSNEATLQCPTCIKLNLPKASFCTQECFKSSWPHHKKIHKQTTKADADTTYNPWPYYRFTGKLRPYRQSSKRQVPGSIKRPDYADNDEGFPISERKVKGNTFIKTLDSDEIDGLRLACKLGREVLDEVAKVIEVGITTDELDRIAHEASVDRECYPSPLNYYRFPKSCCTSINEVICHGIPDMRPLLDGDICNVDVTVYHRGFHGDLNETFLVGPNVSAKAKHLVQTTWECLDQAISAVKPGVRYRDLGNIIQKHAEANRLSVVRSYCGHGIHRLFHCAPNVPHYADNKAVGVMRPGHAFTIEPMINEGVWQDQTWPDDWTSVTVDGKLSAQFEQTLVVTDSGVEILTGRPGRERQAYFIDA